jgi:small subunit ribosomal protein S20
MPNLASAKKRLRQTEKKTLRNQIAKTRIKTETKKVLAGEAELGAVQSVIDRASAKGIIHPNAAARRKSRLAKRVAAAAKS